MVLVEEKVFPYLKYKIDEYTERFGDQNINRFIDFYDQFPDTLQRFFPYSTLNLIVY